MIYFIGTFDYTIDPKGRLTVPNKFKIALGNTFIIKTQTKGNYSCICLYSNEDFQNTLEEIRQTAKNRFDRDRKTFVFCEGSNEVTPDAKGRILVPSMTLEEAGIESECIMVGMFDHVEVWNPEQYKAYSKELKAEEIFEEEAYVSEGHAELKMRANGDFLKANRED